MWDDRKYELVIPGRPTRARRVSVGRPGVTSEYTLYVFPPCELDLKKLHYFLGRKGPRLVRCWY